MLQPQINIQCGGGSVDVQGSGAGGDGALIKAPGAALTIAAGASAATGTATRCCSSRAAPSIFRHRRRHPADVDQPGDLQGHRAEVADDPLAKNLIGQTVTIDLRLSGTRADGLQVGRLADPPACGVVPG